MSKLMKLIKQEGGAIAVETALLIPVLIFALLKAADVALTIHTNQQMAKATKSGIQYVVNGGRNEASIRGIVQDSFNRKIGENDLKITAYCGCISELEQPDGSEATDDNVAGTYTKFVTQISDDMCVIGCDSGNEISALVEIDLSHEMAGIMKKTSARTRLQTRVR